MPTNRLDMEPLGECDDHVRDRRALVLALVVREHVRAAMPVSSSNLVKRYRPGVSAATLRSDMAALEKAGLLTHPHTSAGRVPTVAGYRYFVEHLMEQGGLGEDDQRTIRHQFHQAGLEPERWMRLSAAIVANRSGMAGLVAAPRKGEARACRIDMIDLADDNVQLIAVLDDGQVRYARWRPTQPTSQEELDRICERVNRALIEDGDIGDASAALMDGSATGDGEALRVATELVRRVHRAGAPRLYHAGLSQVLGAPEFAESAKLRDIVELLEHGHGLDMVFDGIPPDGVHVIFGGEPPLEAAPQVTLVISRFGPMSGLAGLVGVVGPPRMAYERAVPTVGFVASVMTQLLAGQPR